MKRTGPQPRCLSSVRRRVPAALLWSALTGLPVFAQTEASFDYPPLRYESAPTDTTLDRLDRDLEAGRKSLSLDARFGYLPALLDALNLPRQSQVLVFSKTSFQNDLITPRTPRAIYFDDTTSVAWIPGSPSIELAALDARQGVIFYTLDPPADGQTPRLMRNNKDCLTCHSNFRTQSVPGRVVRSVYTQPDGTPLELRHDRVASLALPLEERWGGWYATGFHGTHTHLGNAADPLAADAPPRFNRMDLSDRIDPSRYLEPGSDLVALMVLEHQAHVTNLIVRAGFRSRILLDRQAVADRAAGRPGSALLPETLEALRPHGEALLRALLLTDEAPLRGPVRGSSGFAAEYSRKGPRDIARRSLYDLDLKDRLYRHRCSPMILHPAVAQLPKPMRAWLAGRLKEILIRPDAGDDYPHLTPEDRRAILEILRAVRPELLDESAPPAS